MENTKTNPITQFEEKEFQEFLSTLPKERKLDGTYLYFYQNFWCPSIAIKPIISFQNHFQAHDSDIILASIPKSGTTWLKAVLYSIANRTRFPTLNHSPLFTSSPHAIVPFIEFDLYLKNKFPDLESIPEPRIFNTHAPYASLPSSITDSKCKIVYVCRNPLDQFISYWQFAFKLPRGEGSDPTPLEEAFESHCNGIHSFGPFWNHVLGYWNASLQNPDKVLFLKYEDLKENGVKCTKRLAEFMGFPFTAEEELKGVAAEISEFCSFENLKNLEVNKNGKRPSGAPNSSFFRKGEVGDWRNHLTPLMAERLEKLIQEKLEGSGLSFSMSCNKDA
ncbi:cytosolic sulfotransferase 15-like [Mercurialis annua]|uniref:cytosolic sulfotransferase 15-like n=1 Tax=Mercurialis annua TaxID=3986 RepID=UPI00215F0D8D|nr:cytosolic sulfotransferase 15-like [Mercurialis annua]